MTTLKKGGKWTIWRNKTYCKICGQRLERRDFNADHPNWLLAGRRNVLFHPLGKRCSAAGYIVGRSIVLHLSLIESD